MSATATHRTIESSHFQVQSGHDGSQQRVGILPPTRGAGRLPPVSRPSQKALTRFAHSVDTQLTTLLDYHTVVVLVPESLLQYIRAIAERLT